MKEETLEKRWARHRKLGELTRNKVDKWGFSSSQTRASGRTP